MRGNVFGMVTPVRAAVTHKDQPAAAQGAAAACIIHAWTEGQVLGGIVRDATMVKTLKPAVHK
jgi:hypothetical protein